VEMPDATYPEVRVDVKFRNNRLYHYIFDNYKNVADFCKAYSLSPSHVGNLMNLKSRIYTKTFAYTSLVNKLCEIIGELPDFLFPDEMYQTENEVKKNFVEMSLEKARAIAHSSYQNDKVDELGEIIRDGVLKLGNREMVVITDRFGLFGARRKSVEEIARKLNVTRQRALQIQSKALSRLRHPANSRNLRQFVGV
jgi:hypothetical protein